MKETTKLNLIRKARDYDFYFKGDGIDIGCGDDPLDLEIWNKVTSLKRYEIEDDWENKETRPDANTCFDLESNTFNFVYASHILEHMDDPSMALYHWIRICKPNGHIIVAIPHVCWYEKFQWPSKFNCGHKTNWSWEYRTNLPQAIFLPDFLKYFNSSCYVIEMETILENFDFKIFDEDQTSGEAICQIEFILQKK